MLKTRTANPSSTISCAPATATAKVASTIRGPKPGSDKAVAKTSFAKLYQPWGWIVGNGVYLDDVQADIATFSNRMDALLAACVALSLLIAIGSGVHYARSTIARVQIIAGRLMNEAGRLGITASDINTASQQLAESTTEQSAAIEETVTSMEEIGSMIAQTSQSAKDTLQQVNNGQTEAANGQEVVVNMVSAMRDISVANDKLKSLVRLIDEIKNKTKVINDIAFETRLLSFNASIEAARAGAGGPGLCRGGRRSRQTGRNKQPGSRRGTYLAR